MPGPIWRQRFRGGALASVVAVALVALLAGCGSGSEQASTTGSLFDGASADSSMLLTAADLPSLNGRPAFAALPGPLGTSADPVFGSLDVLQDDLAQELTQDYMYCKLVEANSAYGASGSSSPASSPDCPDSPPARTEWPMPVWAMQGKKSCASIDLPTPTAWGVVSLATAGYAEANSNDAGGTPHDFIALFPEDATVDEVVTVYSSATDATAAMRLRSEKLTTWLFGTCPDGPTNFAEFGPPPLTTSTCSASLGDQCVVLKGATLVDKDGALAPPTGDAADDVPDSFMVRRGNVVVTVVASDAIRMGSQICEATSTRSDPESSTTVMGKPGKCGTSTVPASIDSLTSAQVAAITQKALDKIS